MKVSFNPEFKKNGKIFIKMLLCWHFQLPEVSRKIDDIDEKALYYREPYSSVSCVKPFIYHRMFEDITPVAEKRLYFQRLK